MARVGGGGVRTVGGAVSQEHRAVVHAARKLWQVVSARGSQAGPRNGGGGHCAAGRHNVLWVKKKGSIEARGEPLGMPATCVAQLFLCDADGTQRLAHAFAAEAQASRQPYMMNWNQTRKSSSILHPTAA